jgi:hypothetical protein
MVPSESVPSAKPEPSAAEINLLDKLSKNTLFRQIIRDLFNKMMKLTISMLKKK